MKFERIKTQAILLTAVMIANTIGGNITAYASSEIPTEEVILQEGTEEPVMEEGQNDTVNAAPASAEEGDQKADTSSGEEASREKETSHSEDAGPQENPENRENTEMQDDPEGQEVTGEDDGTPQSIRDINRLLTEKGIMGVLYLCDSYGLRKEPWADAEITADIECGTTLYLVKAVYREPELWYYVKAYTEAGEFEGYIIRDQFVCIDEELKGLEDAAKEELNGSWGENFTEEPQKTEEEAGDSETVTSEESYASSASPEAMKSVSTFPDSYRKKLAKLLDSHPSWIFVPQKVGMTLEEAVNAEYSDKNRNWVYSTVDDSYKGEKINSSWYYASKQGLLHYMDPANFVDSEKYIFMFEQLTYNESYHTVEGVKSVLKGSFMSGDIPGEDKSYAQAFQEIGAGLKVSPYHLAAKVYQEQGAKGTSPLISGTYSGYEGYYNYFNVQATGKTNAEIYKNGLAYAKKQGWNTRYKSIKGGSEFDSKNYILAGQDTPYLEKYNIIKKNYNHQYMQNASAPLTEASEVYSMYKNSGSLNNPFVFKIPVFDGDPISGDPEEPEEKKPEVRTGNMLLSSLTVKLNTALSVSLNGMSEITAEMKKGSLPVTLTEIKAANAASQQLIDTGYLKTVISGNTLSLGLIPENRGEIKAGTYRFNVKGGAVASELISYEFKPVKLTVKVIDKSPSKLFSFNAKGSINLVDREDKYITYTPKITDLGSKKLKEIELQGDATELFEAELYEQGSTLPNGKEVSTLSGVVVLKAKSGVPMNRGKTYPVKIVSTLDNDLKIEKTLKVKPVQTPAKTTAKLSANTIPKDGEPVTLTIKTAGKTDNDSVIESVELVSEKQGRFFDYVPADPQEDPHLFVGELRANDSILRSGKYTIKFRVRYRGHGENVKPSVITMNIKVK